jgi:chemotaxis protein MotB
MSTELEDLDDGVEAPSAPFWMTTYSDMITLLLVFFVLIVSMSSVQVQKFKQALSYFQGQTGVLKNDAVVPNPPTNTPKQELQYAEKYEQFIARLKEKNLADKVQVNLSDKGIHVIITDSLMFRSGEAKLIDPSRTILRLLSQIITDDVESIVAEGHTDNRPINTTAFPSNWELSAARAASVIRFLQEQERARPPDRYVAIGYGEHHPKHSNQTTEDRAQNRRVEILLSWEPWQNKINPTLPAQQASSN